MKRLGDGKIESKIICDEKFCSGWRKPGAHGRAPPASAAGSGVVGQTPFSFGRRKQLTICNA